MGTISIVNRKRGRKFIAEVCVRNKRRSKSFDAKKEANAWIVEQENIGFIENKTTHDAFDELKKYCNTLKGKQPALSRLKSLKTLIPNMPLENFSLRNYKAWKDIRSAQLGANAFNRESGMLKMMFTKCIDEWGWLHKHPIPNVERLKDKPPRMRGITQNEIDNILANLKATKHGTEITTLFLLALETAMRLGELLSLEWKHVYEKSVYLPITKNGDSRTVPLSESARKLIASRKDVDSFKVFTISLQNASKSFARHSPPDLHFHDSRSEAISRMSKKLNVLELSKVVGHRDIKSLMYYYKEDLESLADRL